MHELQEGEVEYYGWNEGWWGQEQKGSGQERMEGESIGTDT